MTAPVATANPVVVARELSRRYGDVVAVDGIDFEVRRGECFGFLGPNGAGKSTTMRMIYRASPVGGGSLRVLGFEARDPDNNRKIKRRLGVVPQEDNLDQDLTVRENLEVFARFFALSPAEAARRIDTLLADLALTGRAGVPVLQLSGGMRRRTQIARGLLGDPELLVLDEPTTGLDPQARQDLWGRLELLKRSGATLLLTTHYMDEAEKLCDRLVVMDRGKIVALGSPAELIAERVPSHVVEVKVDAAPASALPPELEAVAVRAERVERLPGRLLLYADHGEALIAEVARSCTDLTAQLRRSSLEDVFLRITGRGLGE